MLFIFLFASLASAAWLPCNFRTLAARATNKVSLRITITVVPFIPIPSRATPGATTLVYQGRVSGGACGFQEQQVVKLRVIRTDPSDPSVTVPNDLLKKDSAYVLQGVCSSTAGEFDVSPCGESFDGSARPDGSHDPLSSRMRSLPPRVQSDGSGVLIFYTNDHKARAEGLQQVTPNSQAIEITRTYQPTQVAGLHTITFWCHGDANQLCDISPSAMVTFLQRAKSLNSGLKTVEFITCNARHYKPGNNGPTNSYAGSVKRGMSGITSSLRGITLKAMPLGATGKRDAWSILLAEATTKSWVYISAPGDTDSLMMHGQGLIRWITNSQGGSVAFKGDIAQRANEVIRDHPKRGAVNEGDPQWSMVYGYFATLRSSLVTV